MKKTLSKLGGDPMTAPRFSRKNAARLGHYKNNIRRHLELLEFEYGRMLKGEPPAIPQARMAIHEGPSWYKRALLDIHQAILRLPRNCPRVTARDMAWLVATLSPGLRWEDNVDEAMKCVYKWLGIIPETSSSLAYGANVEKCLAYLKADRGSSTVVPSGPKVSAFFYSIMVQEDAPAWLGLDPDTWYRDALCIDRWMIRLASGNQGGHFMVAHRAYLEIFENDLRNYQLPSWVTSDITSLQATLWLYIRES